jgi:hypothetical protein
MMGAGGLEVRLPAWPEGRSSNHAALRVGEAGRRDGPGLASAGLTRDPGESLWRLGQPGAGDPARWAGCRTSHSAASFGVIDGSRSTGPWRMGHPTDRRATLVGRIEGGRGRRRRKAERLTLTSEKVRQALQPAGSYRQ